MKLSNIVAACLVGGLIASSCVVKETTPNPKRSPCSATDAQACLVNQQACEMTAGKASCMACGNAQYANLSGACAPLEGTASTHQFSDFTTQPGEENLGLCQSWTLNNDADIWVNAVELTQNEASHHSNWTFVPDTKYAGPDGVWQCTDRHYDQLSAAIAGGVLYAQSTQATHEVQKFPDGAAVRIPAHSRIIGDVHLLNAGSTPVTGHATLSIYSIDAATVTHKLTPFHMTYQGLMIPPMATSRFSGACDLTSDYTKATGTAYAPKVYYVLPHTHKLGTRFFLNRKGGAADGQTLIDITGFNGEARGRAYNPPVDLSGDSGLTFGCEFENPRDTTVIWGFGQNEMCEFLGFWEADAAFESSVDTATSAGNEGQIQLFTGPCTNNFIPWNQKQ